jgi:transcription elongation GreA/GreB family factor
LGAALLGKKIGATTSVKLASKTIEYKIIEIE